MRTNAFMLSFSKKRAPLNPQLACYIFIPNIYQFNKIIFWILETCQEPSFGEFHKLSKQVIFKKVVSGAAEAFF